MTINKWPLDIAHFSIEVFVSQSDRNSCRPPISLSNRFYFSFFAVFCAFMLADLESKCGNGMLVPFARTNFHSNTRTHTHTYTILECYYSDCFEINQNVKLYYYFNFNFHFNRPLRHNILALKMRNMHISVFFPSFVFFSHLYSVRMHAGVMKQNAIPKLGNVCTMPTI